MSPTRKPRTLFTATFPDGTKAQTMAPGAITYPYAVAISPLTVEQAIKNHRKVSADVDILVENLEASRYKYSEEFFNQMLNGYIRVKQETEDDLLALERGEVPQNDSHLAKSLRWSVFKWCPDRLYVEHYFNHIFTNSLRRSGREILVISTTARKLEI